MCWGPYRAACLLRPALVVPFCPVSFGPCAFCVVFCLWCRGFLLAFCFCCCLFLGCFARLCFWCVGLLRLGSLLRSPPALPAPRLVLWCLLVQSVLCWSLPLGISWVGVWGPRYLASKRERGPVQKVPQPSKPTWVSVQDVVLNSLRPSTQPSQLLPELSHFYQTHKHKESVLLMSLWFLLVCHALSQNGYGVTS